MYISKAEEIISSIGSDTTFCAGQEIVLDATSPGATYEWSDGSREPVLYVTSSGIYRVTIRNACFTSQQSVQVTFVDCKDPSLGFVNCSGITQSAVPNIFTSNNDGKNDCFGMQGAAEMKGYSLEVFDRWGKRMFRSSGSVLDWDGEGAASGVYFYVMRFECGEVRSVVTRVIKGSLTLVR